MLILSCSLLIISLNDRALIFPNLFLCQLYVIDNLNNYNYNLIIIKNKNF